MIEQVFADEIFRVFHNKLTINKMKKIKVENHSFTGFSWFALWLFTIGFLHLGLWKGLLALILWPYFLGVYVSNLVQ